MVKALEELKAAFADLDRQNTAVVELLFIRQDLMDNRGCRFIDNLEQVATEAAGFMWTVNALAALFYSHDAIVPQPDELTEGDTDTDDATVCAIVGGKDGA